MGTKKSVQWVPCAIRSTLDRYWKHSEESEIHQDLIWKNSNMPLESDNLDEFTHDLIAVFLFSEVQ